MRKNVKKLVLALFLFGVIMLEAGTVNVKATDYSKKTVMYLQQNLEFLGYSAGEIDGIYGGKTRQAVKNVQAALKRPVTGEVDSWLDTLIKGTVKDIQTYLITKGYLNGSADGIKGYATGTAFKKLQKDMGYPQTAIANLDILEDILKDNEIDIKLNMLTEWVELMGGEVMPLPKYILSEERVNEIKARYEKDGYVVSESSEKHIDYIVADLQELLNAEGGYLELTVDGKFGQATERAIISFQRRYGLVDDGEAGNATWTKLIEVVNARREAYQSGALDIHAMLKYAQRYWKNYNPEYKEHEGNDCANYVSQILCAGGVTETKEWHGALKWGEPETEFTNVQGLVKYMQERYGIQYIDKKISINDIEVGDCVDGRNLAGQAHGHIVYVIGVDRKAGKVYFTGHTSERYYGIPENTNDSRSFYWLSQITGVLKTSDIRIER